MTGIRYLLQRIGVRPTLRGRLTALYAVAFFGAGFVLLAVMYGLVAWNLDQPRAFAIPAPASGAPDSDVLLAPDGPVATQVIAAQQRLRDETLSALLYQSLLALVAVGVGAAGLGYVVAGRALRPLHQITATARRVAGDRSLHERIALDGPQDEIKELADTFDAMLARLDAAFAGQRRFAANASHELRTPLAVNRTLLEVALADPNASADLRGLGRTLLATSERSERLIDGLLLLARSDDQLEERKPVDLAEVAAHAVDQTRAEAAESGLRVTTVLDAAPATGDPLLLERLALNLVQNAVRHNVPGGDVEVRTGREPSAAVLEVSNTGPEIQPYEVDTLFEPFRRLRNERIQTDRGVGLGLSIVRSVTRAHGGAVTAAPRQGGGLVVRVILPAHS